MTQARMRPADEIQFGGGVTAAKAAASRRTPKGERSRRIMHFGEIEVRYLDGGGFRLDGGAMFGVVPKPLWEKKSPPDEKNRIRMRANALLVRAAGKIIVVETG